MMYFQQSNDYVRTYVLSLVLSDASKSFDRKSIKRFAKLIENNFLQRVLLVKGQTRTALITIAAHGTRMTLDRQQ